MVSPELLRRYPFFAGLSMEQITTLAKLADEVSVAADHYLFREGDELERFYIVREGKVALIIGLMALGDRTSVAELAAKEREIVIGTVGAGEVLAWSALAPPYRATASGKTQAPCRLIGFDCAALRPLLVANPELGYLLMQKVVQVARDRLNDMHNESLAYAAE